MIVDGRDRRRVADSVVRLNGSHALQSVPSKARTYMVSEPPVWPPRTQTLPRSAAATVMAVLAGLWALLGRPEIAAVGTRAAVPELVLGRRVAIGVGVGNPTCTCDHSLVCKAVIVDGGDRRRVATVVRLNDPRRSSRCRRRRAPTWSRSR